MISSKSSQTEKNSGQNRKSLFLEFDLKLLLAPLLVTQETKIAKTFKVIQKSCFIDQMKCLDASLKKLFSRSSKVKNPGRGVKDVKKCRKDSKITSKLSSLLTNLIQRPIQIFSPFFFLETFRTLTKSRMRLNERWDHHFYRISI